MSETLRQKQVRFVRQLARLVDYAESLGYELTLGDGYRDPRVFGKVGEQKGYGRSRSNHKIRLAQDYNLFINGVWMQNSEDFALLGEFWESLSSDSKWGGHYNDGNHFSIEHEGRQ